MPNVIVTHVDGSTTVYPNCMAGISNDQGNGWKLSVIPTDSSQPAFVVDLRSGEKYQESGSLPTAPAFAAPAQAIDPTVAAVSPDVAVAADVTLLANVEQPAMTDTVTAPAAAPDPTL
jgi:hypothetical protein